ncbi:hypothetical protein SAMN04488104_102746 [Algoriphagus faecimaris]|uniref:Oligosaccharide repeat unit polymerase n=1 Tax=Algoriphagus faecimaris TaxID=686796 RepID=A0A1G6UBK8_9BACT|nr:O-antigen polymerase [Algoriphagus faecimaris]SDD38634.1 hypothetical protein SAMN04488104_102746 [Algoriphagus faecimaris]
MRYKSISQEQAILLFGVLISFILFHFSVSSYFINIFTSIIISVYGVTLFFNEKERFQTIIHPLVLRAIYKFFIGIAGAFLTLFIFPDYEGMQVSIIQVPITNIAFFSILYILGELFYITAFKNHSKNINLDPVFKSKKFSINWFVISATFFLLFALFPSAFKFLGSLGVLLNRIGFALLLLIIYSNIKDNIKHPLLVFSTLVVVGLNINKLSKAAIFLAIIPYLFYILIKYRKNLTRLLLVYLLPLGSALYLFVFPFVSVARYYYFGDNPEQISFSTAFNMVYNVGFLEKYSNISSAGSIFYQREIYEIIFLRMYEMPVYAVVVDFVNEGGYKFGEAFDKLIYGLIPRLIWPEKPIMVSSYEFGNLLGAEGTAIGVSDVGDLYWNFGILGIPIGMYILGMITARFFNFILRINNSVVYFLGYTLIIYSGMASSGSEFVASLLGWFQYLVIFYLLYLFLRIK